MKPLAPISSALRLSLGAASIVALLAAWQLLVDQHWVPDSALAGPMATARAAADLMTQQGYGGDLRWTVIRVLEGFVLAAVLGVPLGVLLGTYQLFDACVRPVIALGRYLSPPAFIPLLVLWNDFDEMGRVAVVFVGTFFPLALTVAMWVRSTRRELVDAAYTLGVPDRRILSRVLLPAAAPRIFESMRWVLGRAWSYVIAAEMFGAMTGVGHVLMESQSIAPGAAVAAILLLALVALIIDRLFKLINQKLFPWAPI